MRAGLVASAAVVTAGMLVGPAGAAEVDAGGYLDEVMRAAQQNLLRPTTAPQADESDFRVTVSIDAGPRSALTAFTPRLTGPGLGAAHTAALKALPGVEAAPSEPSRQMHLGLSETTKIAGFEVGMAATAGMAPPQPTAPDSGSGFVVGGELALLGLRFDAAYGQDAWLLGLDGDRMTAGVSYGFGALDARVGYSQVKDATALETSLFTLGSQLTLQPGVILQGDLAYAQSEQRDPTTAGLVSLRLNF